MRRVVGIGISIGVLVVPAIAQDRQPPTVTPTDYARAERLAPAPRTPATSSDAKPLALSPDGKRGAFVRDWNLWIRDMSTARSTRRRPTA
jgi:Dipeptidyl peptidase IV (DPP IV) N-terminal region